MDSIHGFHPECGTVSAVHRDAVRRMAVKSYIRRRIQ